PPQLHSSPTRRSSDLENHIDGPLATQADFSPSSRDSFGEFLATEDCVALSEGGETPSPAGDSFDDFLAGSDGGAGEAVAANPEKDRKSTRLNSSHVSI